MQTDFNQSRPDAQATSVVSALIDLVRSIPAIQGVELLRLAVPPSVELRPGAQAHHAAYADEARRAQLAGDSFTEAFLTAADRNGDLATALELVDYHQPFADAPSHIEVAVDDLTDAAVNELASSTPPDQMLVMTSKVGTAAGVHHLPMLDFKIAANERNEPAAKAVAGRLGGGLLVNSGSSYHLYGTTLLDTRALNDWLLHAQLFSRCVDTRWVTHQLIERCAALRISKGGSRNLRPQVVARITGD